MDIPRGVVLVSAHQEGAVMEGEYLYLVSTLGRALPLGSPFSTEILIDSELGRELPLVSPLEIEESP